jgi:hypothetical protein
VTRFGLLVTSVLACVASATPVSAAEDGPQVEVRTLTKVTAKPGADGAGRLSVLLDVHEAPAAKDWALDAAKYTLKWYPKLCELLASDGFEAPDQVTLLFKPMEGVAHTSGTTITISADWIRQHPDDVGMVAHELVHVVQSYGRTRAPGWLTEGIADYVRYYVVEPDSDRRHFDAGRMSYESGYQPAAGLLNWIEQRSPGTVAKLNALIRQRKYTPGAFEELAGGDPAALWDEFKASLKKP